MRKSVAAAALAAFTVRLFFVRSPVMADEAGLLMVAAQWQPGSSLYGDYWVDRPPGLIAVVALADALGGSLALRVIAALAAAAAVVSGAWLGARVAPGRAAPVAGAVIVAALVSSPLLDVDEISAEILALPLVLAGLALVLGAVGQAASWQLVAAGAAGTAAVLLKQNLVEVWLAGAVVTVVLLRRGEVRRASRLVWCFLCGAVLAAAPLVLLAWVRGTSPAALWDATVVFRIDAGSVLAEGASEATPQRAGRLALAFVATGMPALFLLLARLRWHPSAGTEEPASPGNDPAPALACLLLLGWEALVVAFGGSYWLHYLLILVPGLTLLVAAGMRRSPAFPRWVLAPVLVSTVVGLAVVLTDPVERPAEDQAVIDYLVANRERGSTAVVAFGNPALLWSADMRSPYEHLWSLPVRVLDPDLRELVRVLRGPGRPQWVVRLGSSLETWGVEADRADRVLERRYRTVYVTDTYTILARRPSREAGAAPTA